MKNWKTTIVGCITAILIAVQPLIATGNIDWQKVGLGALVALMGYLAKDAGVSGVEK